MEDLGHHRTDQNNPPMNDTSDIWMDQPPTEIKLLGQADIHTDGSYDNAAFPAPAHKSWLTIPSSCSVMSKDRQLKAHNSKIPDNGKVTIPIWTLKNMG